MYANESVSRFLWSWVAVDSALTYRQSREAIDHAIEADPIEELYDGPQEQSGRIKRWLLWSPGSTPPLGRRTWRRG